MWTKKDTIEMKMKDKRMEEESLVHLKETAELSQQLCDTIDEMIKDEDKAIEYYEKEINDTILTIESTKKQLTQIKIDITNQKNDLKQDSRIYSDDVIQSEKDSILVAEKNMDSSKKLIKSYQDSIKIGKKALNSHKKTRQHLIEWREKAIAHHVFDVNYVNFSEDLLKKYAAEIEELQRQVNYNDKGYGHH